MRIDRRATAFYFVILGGCSAGSTPPSELDPLQTAGALAANTLRVSCDVWLGEGSGPTPDTCVSYYPESVSSVSFVADAPITANVEWTLEIPPTETLRVLQGCGGPGSTGCSLSVSPRCDSGPRIYRATARYTSFNGTTYAGTATATVPAYCGDIPPPPPPPAPPPPAPPPSSNLPNLGGTAQMTMVSDQWVMKTGDVLGDGVVREHLAEIFPGPGVGRICRKAPVIIQIPVFNTQCSIFNSLSPLFNSFCVRSLPTRDVFLGVRTVCTTNTSPPFDARDSRIRKDASGLLERTLRAGDFRVVDIGSLQSPLTGAPFGLDRLSSGVAFGIKKGGTYALPADFGGMCPTGFAMVNSLRLAPLGSDRACVQVSTFPNELDVKNPNRNSIQARLGGATIDAILNPPASDGKFKTIIDILREILGDFLSTAYCTLDDADEVGSCVTNNGDIDSPAFARLLALGICPTVPDFQYMQECEQRGEQSDIGCFAIACIKALNAEGLTKCSIDVAQQIRLTTAPLGGFPAEAVRTLAPAAGIAACLEIRERDHRYLAPRDGTPVTLCDYSEPGCTLPAVMQTRLSDARHQAPMVLQGPPVNGKPAKPLVAPLPIVSGNTYFLGDNLDLKLFSTPLLTSNPIDITVQPGGNRVIAGVTRNCFQVLQNATHIDHLLQGEVNICVFIDPSTAPSVIKAVAEGTGKNTRLALANEQIGPIVIGNALEAFRQSVRAKIASHPCAFGGCGHK